MLTKNTEKNLGRCGIFNEKNNIHKALSQTPAFMASLIGGSGGVLGRVNNQDDYWFPIRYAFYAGAVVFITVFYVVAREFIPKRKIDSICNLEFSAKDWGKVALDLSANVMAPALGASIISDAIAYFTMQASDMSSLSTITGAMGGLGAELIVYCLLFLLIQKLFCSNKSAYNFINDDVTPQITEDQDSEDIPFSTSTSNLRK